MERLFRTMGLLTALLGLAFLIPLNAAKGAAPGLPAEDAWWKRESAQRSFKLKTPAMSLADSKAQFEARKNRLLGLWAAKDLSKDQYAARAIANLYTGQWTEEAEASLRSTVEGKLAVDLDFAALKLMRAYWLFGEPKKLQPATVEAIRGFFRTKDVRSQWNEQVGKAAENHEIQFHTARFLAAQAFPGETFEAYHAAGSELVKRDSEWLKAAIRFRAEQGWGEFDSSVYYRVDMECLLCLYDFSRDAELQRLAAMMLDLMLADIAVDSLNGMYGGAHARVFYFDVLKHSTEDTYGLQYLYFGNVDPHTIGGLSGSVDAITSGYRPSDVVVQIAIGRKTPYENRERKCLHKPDDVMPNSPLSGSIRKYTYWTPDYVLGCVQFQDPYPESYSGKYWAHHQQQEWDLTFGSRTRTRIFTHHPGKLGIVHARWTGDMSCNCGHFFQNKTALVALYDIPAGEPCQYIHAFVPRKDFDELVEEDGFIFVREGQVCAALKMLGGHEWADDPIWHDAEVISRGARNGAVCEVGLAQDYGGFDAFRREIAANALHFDPQAMELTYGSKRAGELLLNTKGVRRLDGKPAPLDYATYDNPYMHSAWQSGVVEIRDGDSRLLLDFPESNR